MARIEKTNLIHPALGGAVWTTQIRVGSNQAHEIIMCAKNAWGGSVRGDEPLLKFDHGGRPMGTDKRLFENRFASLVAENHGTTLNVFFKFFEAAALVFVHAGKEDVVRKVNVAFHGNPTSYTCMALHANPDGEDVPAFLVCGAEQSSNDGNYIQQWWNSSGTMLQQKIYANMNVDRMEPPNYLPLTGTVVFWPHDRNTQSIQAHLYHARTGSFAGKVDLRHPIADDPHRAVEFSKREIGFFYQSLKSQHLETLGWSLTEACLPLDRKLVIGERRHYDFNPQKVTWSLERFPHNLQPILDDDASDAAPGRRALVFGDKKVWWVDFDRPNARHPCVALFQKDIDKRGFQYRTTPPSTHGSGVVFYVIRARNDVYPDQLYRCRFILPGTLIDASVDATVDSVLGALARALPDDLYDLVSDALVRRLKVARKNKAHVSV